MKVITLVIVIRLWMEVHGVEYKFWEFFLILTALIVVGELVDALTDHWKKLWRE